MARLAGLAGNPRFWPYEDVLLALVVEVERLRSVNALLTQEKVDLQGAYAQVTAMQERTQEWLERFQGMAARQGLDLQALRTTLSKVGAMQEGEDGSG